MILGVVLAGCVEPQTEDAGEVDSGRDAGAVDAGAVDAGWDAGAVDAGWDAGEFDAGWDAGTVDAGWDAGFVVDAGWDAGAFDAGWDAGAFDAGSDAGAFDAGWDAGALDAGWDDGSLDAGSVDAGSPLRGRLWMWGTIGPSPTQVYAQVPVGATTTTVSATGRTATGMAVSEDGAMIAISYDSPAELFVGPTDGGPAQLLRSSPGLIRVFALSADKGQVAFFENFSFNEGAMIVPVDGGPALEATPRSTSSLPISGTGSFSPDSSHFNWVGFLDSSNRMYVTNTLTGTRTQVTVPSANIMNFAWTSAAEFWLVAFSSSGGSLHACSAPAACAPLIGLGSVRTLSVSRDRTLAVIGADSADAGSGLRLDISRVPLDGGAALSMATNFRLNTAVGGWALSPDGERLVAQGLLSSDRALFVMPTSAFSSPAPLLMLPSGVGAEKVVFSPDSTQLLFRSNLEGFGTASADGWGLQRLDLTVPVQPPILQQRVDGGIMWDFVWTP